MLINYLNINWIIGDINDRVYPKTFSYLPNKERLIDVFLNNVDGIDVWRGLHRTLPGHTRWKDEKSSSRLDYWIISKKWWKTIKKYIDFRIHHVSDSGSDHRAIVLSFPILLQPHLPNVPFRIFKPKLPKNGINNEILNLINSNWINQWNNKWTLDLIHKFTFFLKNEIIQLYGTFGGQAYYKLQNNHYYIYQNIRELKYLAALIRSITEAPTDIMLERWIQLSIHYLKNLKKHNIIPHDIDINKLTLWLNKNLKNKLIELKFQIKTDDNIKKNYYEKEKSLFSDIRKRSEWLNWIGMGKKKITLSPYLTTHDLKLITKPEKINEIYYNSFSKIFQNYFTINNFTNLSNIKIIPNVSKPRPFYQDQLPDHGNRPFWWNKFYNRKAKNIPFAIWDDLIKPITIDEINNTIKNLAPDLSVDNDGNSSNLLKQLFQDQSPLTVHLCNILNQILIFEDMPKEWKKFYITLIPKHDNQ